MQEQTQKIDRAKGKTDTIASSKEMNKVISRNKTEITKYKMENEILTGSSI